MERLFSHTSVHGVRMTYTLPDSSFAAQYTADTESLHRAGIISTDEMFDTCRDAVKQHLLGKHVVMHVL